MNGPVKRTRPKPLHNISDVKNLSLSDCRVLWNKLYHTSPPSHASLDFLRGNLSWRIQALAAGEDPIKLRQSFLNKLKAKPPLKKAQDFKPGTRLIRAWNGTTHEVTVLESGYQWRGERYRSLSHIAREITGTQWSGPRFFGLTK